MESNTSGTDNGMTDHKAVEKRSHVWYNKVESDDDAIMKGPGVEILRTYSKIPEDKLREHICNIRDQAWKIYPYPCVGMFNFLQLGISENPAYPEVLERVKRGEKLLELGCCFGQDIRKLVADGAPSENLYGSDLHGLFWKIGYDLFGDAATLQTPFIAADALDPSCTPLLLGALEPAGAHLSIIHASWFLHLFAWPDQAHILATVVVPLLAARGPGALLVGRNLGNPAAGEYPKLLTHQRERLDGGAWATTCFRHDEASWARLWAEVGGRTGTRWDARSWLEPMERSEQMKKMSGHESTVTQHFVVRRL